MARGAIDRNVALCVAAKAIAHVQVHGTNRRDLLQQIPMAIRAGDARADVRCVIKLDVSRGAVVVNAYPGDVFTTRLVTGHFPDFRPIFGDHQMAAHAELHAGDGGIRPLIHASVADLAL